MSELSAPNRSQQRRPEHLAALELPGKTFSGSGTARHMSAGARFNLSQHEHYPDAGDTNQFKLLWVEHGAANNLNAQVSDLLARLNLYAKSASSQDATRTSSFYNNSNTASVKNTPRTTCKD